MPAITYVGPSDAVEIPSLGLVAVKGEPIEVPADAAKALLAQDVFESAKTKAKE